MCPYLKVLFARLYELKQTNKPVFIAESGLASCSAARIDTVDNFGEVKAGVSKN